MKRLLYFFILSIVKSVIASSYYGELRSGLCNPAEAAEYRYRNTSVLSWEIGRRFSKEFRGGFQVSYAHFDCSNAGALLVGGHPMNLGNVKCRVYTYSCLANIYYDHDFSDRVSSFIGCGIGVARVRVFSRNLRPFFGGFFNSESKVVLTYQVSAGIVYTVNDTWSLVADYRCQKMENFEMETMDLFRIKYYSTVRTPSFIASKSVCDTLFDEHKFLTQQGCHGGQSRGSLFFVVTTNERTNT